jgi:hypothetical protein
MKDQEGNFVAPQDPDGHEIYLWETHPQTVPETELEHAGKA